MMNGVEERDELARRTEGPFPQSTNVQDELERDLEKEVVRQLHEENWRLKQKLQEMEEKERTCGSGWSEVTAGGGTPPPPPPEDWELVRWTPNGTKVPRGPPPSDVRAPQVPDWPLDAYEKVKADAAGTTCATSS